MTPGFPKLTKTVRLLFFLLGTLLMHTCVSAQLLTTIAGNGTPGFSGDGAPAKQAQLYNPGGICFDANGNLYIADHNNHRIRKVDKQTGFISTIAGNGTPGFSGDGGPAINAQLNNPAYLVTDGGKGLYVSDYSNLRVRRIDLATGIITTVAGNGTENYVNGGLATQSGLLPIGLAFDPGGNLFISQHMPPLVNYTSNIISKVDKQTGIITTYAGNGQFTFAGDGGPALQASFWNPYGICFDAAGNLYVADLTNVRVRKIDAVTGIVSTVAGNGSGVRFPPNGTPAVNAGLVHPTDVKIDPAGNLVIVDQSDLIIWKVDKATGLLTAIVGTHYLGDSPDCVPATSKLHDPTYAAFDPSGNLCFSELAGHRVRMIIPATNSTISISPSSTDVCLQNLITFTAQTTGLGAQPVFQWTKNGANVGTNSNIYTDKFKLNDVVTCVLTPGTCGNSQVTSNSYRVTGTSEVAPVVDITASATEICPGTSASFTATNTSGSLDPSYQWYINNNPVGTNNTLFTTSNLANGDVVTCIMTVPHCTTGSTKDVSDPITIKQVGSLNASVSIQASAITVCKGSAIDFTATTQQAGSAPQYRWKINNIPAGDNSARFSTSALSNGDVVSCTIITEATSCGPSQTVVSNTIKLTINEVLVPSVTIQADRSEICEGETIHFTALAKDAGPAPKFQWLVNGLPSGTNDANLGSQLKSGDRVSCVLTPDGCGAPVSSNTIGIVVHPTPLFHITPADTTVAAGTAVDLKATVQWGGYRYEWAPATQLTNTNSLQVVTIPLDQTTTFQLKLTSDKGCTAIQKAIVKVVREFYMPSAFSPNGDGKNDVFRIPPGVQLKLKAFAVYDRWGNIVFKTSNPGKGWDGSFSGQPLSSGVYVYTISGEDSKGPVEFKGTVLLIR